MLRFHESVGRVENSRVGERGAIILRRHRAAAPLDNGYAFMALVRFIALIGVAVCFLLAPQLNTNARAIAQLVSIDAPITSEKMEPLKKYFDGIDTSKAKVFSREFEGLTIVRVE